MRYLLLVALVGVATMSMPSSTQGAAEWRQLFNGKDLSGWRQVGPGEFAIENGQLKTVGGMGLLWYTREKFGDTTLRIVYRAPEKGGNSGVFIRIPGEPTEAWMPVNKGFEVQIDDSGDAHHRTGVLYSFTKAEAQPTARDWNTMDITLEGDRTVVVVNGVTVTDFREGDAVPARAQSYEPERGPRPKSGYIGLQNHDAKDTVWFREISVRR